MKVLITGAAGNLGSYLAKFIMNDNSGLTLRLMFHNKPLPYEINEHVEVCKADLMDMKSLRDASAGIDCIVHFAGLLFAPNPEKFLPTTNVVYFQNLVNAALESGVKKIILISFPHVEGNSSPEHPATGRLDGNPVSVHAQTRLKEEQYMFEKCKDTQCSAVSLRAGMIYGKDILMIDGMRYLMKIHLLGIWKKPNWIHLITIYDFLEATKQAIIKQGVKGIYHLGDDKPMYLVEYLDRMAEHLGYSKPWRMPVWMIFTAAWLVEQYAKIFRTRSPLTRDFIRIGMVSYTGETKRMKEDLMPKLKYPTLDEGMGIL